MSFVKPKFIALTVFILLVFMVLVFAEMQARKIDGIEYEGRAGLLGGVEFKGQHYTLVYIRSEYPTLYYGRAYGKVAEVREDLSPHMKRFVTLHELYHLVDTDHSGVIKREIRANAAAGMHEPLGFLQTLGKSVTSPARLKYYWGLYGP